MQASWRFAGHTAPLTLECAMRPQSPERVELTGQTRVGRRHFAMSGGQLPGMIPAEVDLSLAVVLLRDGGG